MSELIQTLKSLIPASGKQSVLFITLHRSGSSFTERHLLPNLNGLRHVDFASRIYNGRKPHVKFNTNGFVYGPIRLSAYPNSPVYSHVVRPILECNFLSDFKIIFFVRDPRARLLSSYRAFGRTHGLSENKSIVNLQNRERSRIKEQNITQYIHSSIDANIQYYEQMIALSKNAPYHTFLRYEDMVFRWDEFIKRLRSVVDLSYTSEKHLKRKIKRPNTHQAVNSADVNSWSMGHHLNHETLEMVNMRFSKILDFLGYGNS